MKETAPVEDSSHSALEELRGLYRTLRYDLVEWVSDRSRVNTSAVVEGIGNFARFGIQAKTLVFDLFELRRSLRELKAVCQGSFREEERELVAQLQPLEVKLEALIAPLDVSYFEKLLHLLRVYAYAYRGTDYPPDSYITRLYREQLTAPTLEGYGLLQQAARRLTTLLGLEIGLAWMDEQEKVAEALDELEIQYLLSFAALLPEDSSAGSAP